MNKQKLLAKALAGSKNLRFTEAITLAKEFGYRLVRTKGSHHILVHPKIKELSTFKKSEAKQNPIKYASCLI